MDGTPVAVRAVRTVGPDTIAVELETPADFDARPGQFVQLGATIDGEAVARYYTLSSSEVGDTFEVTVGIDPEGTLSPWLADVDSGATVEVAGPFGDSYYDGEDAVVVLAGGPGVGPAVGIGERALAAGGEVAVVYQDDEPAHEDRLAALSDAGATVLVVTGDDITDAVARALDTGGQTFVYGFADFLSAAEDAIEAAGGDPEDAKTENFGPAP